MVTREYPTIGVVLAPLLDLDSFRVAPDNASDDDAFVIVARLSSLSNDGSTFVVRVLLLSTAAAQEEVAIVIMTNTKNLGIAIFMGIFF